MANIIETILERKLLYLCALEREIAAVRAAAKLIKTQAMDEDASEPDPRAFYPAFAEAVKDMVDAPAMQSGDEDTASCEKP